MNGYDLINLLVSMPACRLCRHDDNDPWSWWLRPPGDPGDSRLIDHPPVRELEVLVDTGFLEVERRDAPNDSAYRIEYRPTEKTLRFDQLRRNANGSVGETLYVLVRQRDTAGEVHLFAGVSSPDPAIVIADLLQDERVVTHAYELRSFRVADLRALARD